MKPPLLLPTLVAFSSCVPLTHVHEHPHRNHPAPETGISPTSALQDLHGLMVGIWSFPQIDPEVSPVVIHFNADASYAMETEGAMFEKGRWSLQGSRVQLVPVKGRASAATVQAKSANELIWKSEGKQALRLTRI